MPTRPTVLIEGEGPLNDACALTTYRVAVRGGFSRRARRVLPAGAAGQFAWAVAGGLLVGAGVALAIRAARPLPGDPLTANAVSPAAQFGTCLVANRSTPRGCRPWSSPA